MRPSQEIGRCGYTLASGRRCLGSREFPHEHFDLFNTEPQSSEDLSLAAEIWLAERDFAIRMTGINPDDPCPAIVPFEPGRMVRA